MGLKKLAMVSNLRRQATLLLMAMAAALMFSSGVALAATITCQVNVTCYGTREPDTLEGTASGDAIYGRGNNDILRGRGSNDGLFGQGGSDRLVGSVGEDSLFGGPGNDTLNGGAETDLYYIFTNNWGKDSIADSSTSANALRFSADEGEVTDDLSVKLISGAGPEVKNASGTSTINWESTTLIRHVQSGDGDDDITGDFFDNTIYGGQGTDTIYSLSGNDKIYVADGEVDNVDCGSGLFGSQDYDEVHYDSFDIVSDNCEVQVLDAP